MVSKYWSKAVILSAMAALLISCGYEHALSDVSCESTDDCVGGAICDDGFCVLEPGDVENDENNEENKENNKENNENNETPVECDDSLIRCGDSCVDELVDPAHCGECDNACDSGQSCEAGVCEDVVECDEALDDQAWCSGQCVNPLTDEDHCGECSNACAATQHCSQGECTCSGNDEFCSDQCVDLQTDDDHCGVCGNGCAATQHCSGGQCTCFGDDEFCNGQCVDTNSHDGFCGDCNTSCASDEWCLDGVCVDECDESLDSQMLCGAQCVNPQQDLEHCTTCNMQCTTSVSNAEPVCEPGGCTHECVDDFEECVAGTCFDLQSTDAHCGGCNQDCYTVIVGATAECVAGDCILDCPATGITYCEGSNGAADACVDTQVSDEHCGECGESCASGEFCDGGGCEPLPCYEGGGPFGGGEGIAGDPYTICTLAHLQNIDDSDYLGDRFELHADIDLSGVTFEPIGRGGWDSGSLYDAFEGHFYGNGHVIDNLTIGYNGNQVGLFGDIAPGALVDNIVLSNVSVEGDDYVGAVAGRNYGVIQGCEVSGEIEGDEQVGAVAGRHLGSIEGCSVVDGQSTTTVTGYVEVGGLVGVHALGTIEESQSAANVSAAAGRAGGLVGHLTEGSIIKGEATGDVEVTGTGASAGGLVGRMADINGRIEESFATGDVTGANFVGGLIGAVHGTVEDSYAEGDVQGVQYVGGLVGRLSGEDGRIFDSHAEGFVVGIDDVGGLAGVNVGQIHDSTAEGGVDGVRNTGGLVGRNITLIVQSSASGAVFVDPESGDGGNRVGGLVGENLGIIDASFATGDVTATAAERVGGLAGRVYWDAQVYNSYAKGNVEGEYMVGGLVGIIAADFDETNGRVETSHSSGTVVAPSGSFSGGLIGRNFEQNDTINSYWNINSSARADSAGGTGLSASDFTHQSNYPTIFTGFSFGDIWYMASDGPRLIWEIAQ